MKDTNRIDIKTIGGRIREKRTELGLSQEKLGELLYMKKSTISAYETNTNDVPGKVIVELAKVLETTPNYLLLGEVEEDDWMQEMKRVLGKIENPGMRALAMNQMKCFVNL